MKKIITTLIVLQLAFVAFFMIKYRPYQQVYFNYLVSHKPQYLRTHFDLDYWGVSVKEGLEFILANDKSPIIRVSNSIIPIEVNTAILPSADRQRIVLVDPEKDPDYFITFFRGHPANYNYPQVLLNKEVLNSAILRVYKTH